MADVRDDRVLVTTRWVSICIVPILLSAFVILYFFPKETKALWAWTIAPPMTAMFMGAGYLAGSWFFIRAATVREGHRVTKGLIAISVFAALLELATLLHWDRFNHGHVSFWAWFFLYTVTPVLLPLLWFMNRRTDPGGAAPGDMMPPWLRAAMSIGGVIVVAFAAAMFVRPSLFLGDWPWQLTPLTARVLAAFFAFPAIAWALFAVDARWSSFEIPIQVSIIGLALIIVATIRAWDQFRSEDDAWVYLGMLTVALLWLCGVHLGMRHRARGAGAT